MRGEQKFPPRALSAGLGSPPLARGTGFSRIDNAGAMRITPACAGNSCVSISSAYAAEDHPRLRGEQANAGYLTAPVEGSPPLARGTESINTFPSEVEGITPACAGNSIPRRTCPPCRWDHPRLRGEQFIKGGHFKATEGSPPLARGTD